MRPTAHLRLECVCQAVKRLRVVFPLVIWACTTIQAKDTQRPDNSFFIPFESIKINNRS